MKKKTGIFESKILNMLEEFDLDGLKEDVKNEVTSLVRESVLEELEKNDNIRKAISIIVKRLFEKVVNKAFEDVDLG